MLSISCLNNYHILIIFKPFSFPCETGDINEYKDIEQTISPIVLKEISNWTIELTRTNKKKIISTATDEIRL